MENLALNNFCTIDMDTGTSPEKATFSVFNALWRGWATGSSELAAREQQAAYNSEFVPVSLDFNKRFMAPEWP